MNTRIVAVTVMLIALWVVALTLVGCNTWEGAGKDIEKTGEAMQGD